MAAPDPGFTPVSVTFGSLGEVYVADLRGSTARILRYGGIFYGYSTLLATLTANHGTFWIAQVPMPSKTNFLL